jgi:hypothetical protein
MYGENPQHQYGGPMGSEKAREMTQRWVHEFGGFNGLRPSDISGFDMSYYTVPKDLGKTEAHFLGQYVPWDSHRNADLAIQHGFRTLGRPPGSQNWWEWENLDNAQTGLHDFLMYLKYGYTRADAQLSVDIRSGRIVKEDAIIESMKRRGFPDYYAGVNIHDALYNIGMSWERFEQIMRQYDSIGYFDACAADHSTASL